MGLSFTLRKHFSQVFQLKNLSTTNIVGVSLFTGMAGIVVGAGMYERPEKPDTYAAIDAAHRAETEITQLGKENTELFTLKRDRVTAAEAVAYTSAKDAPAAKKKLADMQKREGELTAKLEDIYDVTYSKIALNPAIAEADVPGLLQHYAKAMGYEKLTGSHEKLALGAPFLNECRAAFAHVAGGPEASAVVSCAYGKTFEDREQVANVQTFTQFGATGLFVVLNIMGFMMRRRVEKEENDMRDDEVRRGVDHLREMLKPGKPRL